MKDLILKEIKSMKGSLLGIGIDDLDMLDEIEENDNIDTCYILSSNQTGIKKFNFYKKGQNKIINIKKIKKYFRKKSLNNIICNYDTIKKFMKGFIPNSVYLNNGTLYIYGNLKDLKNLKERYNRYTNDTELIKNNKEFLLKVNNKNTKNNVFKDLIYKIKDLFDEIIDFLTDLLIN